MSYSPPADEEALYEPVHSFLQLRFQDRLRPAKGDLHYVSAITARAGGANTGLWSKPDLSIAALWRFKFGLRWEFDLHGFEVKPRNRCDLTAVHEALNHTSMVHFSHLVWHKPDWDDREAKCATILQRCERHGIGLITFTDERNVDSFSIRLPGRRFDPRGDAVDDFIDTRFDAGQRDRLLGLIEERR